MREFRFATSDEAEAAFYNAFARASLEDMMQVWADEGPVVCIHPMGPRLRDIANIAENWRRIFSGGERLHIEPSDVRVIAGASIAAHSVAEQVVLGDGRRGLVLATNVYRLTEAGWRMAAHHGSPVPGSSTPAPADEPPQRMH